MHHRLPFVILLLAMELSGQEKTDVQPTAVKEILQRLDSLERENKELVQQVQELREELKGTRQAAASTATPSPPPSEEPTLNERVAVQEQRTSEQAQTKVEATHKFPIQLNGLLLFNAFANSAEDRPYSPTQDFLLSGPARSGATVRQTLLGLDFQGPSLPGGGRVNGSLTMDFWAGGSEPGSSWIRLRRADISLDWKNRSFSVGQDKPLISPYQPDSLAEVGVPPLAGAGNFWLWLPQVRYEERLHFGTSTGLTGQLAVMQTDEDYAATTATYTESLASARPALEGRFAFWHKFDDRRRFEIAPGFHVSTTHVAGTSVPSRIASLDWLVVPWSHFQISGTVFQGQNVASLGALHNGFAISSAGYVHPVHSSGGWTQFAFPITKRLTFNIFTGLESDDPEYLSAATIVHNWTYAANFQYHLGPNVVVGLEALQMRTRSVSGIAGVQNHYDLALGYLF